jgi:exopolysaccharide production protein ExoQ
MFGAPNVAIIRKRAEIRREQSHAGDVVIEALIVAGCFTALWSNADAVGSIARPLIFVFLFLAVFLAFLTGKVRRIATTPTELLLYVVGVLSAAVSVVLAEDYSILYTTYFFAAIVVVSVLARTVSLERLLDLGAQVTILCILACAIVERHNLLSALAVTIGKHGLFRFTPLGNHPLLTGDIFGGGSILLIRRLYLSRNTLERCVMAVGILCAWSFALAASARSSVVALGAAAAFAIVVELRLTSVLFSKRAGLAVVAIAACILLYVGPAHKYLEEMLALNSAYRGVGSGATGRTDLWMRGLSTLFSDPSRLALGGGLRSSEVVTRGVATESSYITILLDSGIFFGSALIALFVYAPVSALKLSRSSTSGSNSFAFLPSFFVFLLVQCFFIRDLVGLGNPISLMTLFFITSLSMSAGFHASLQAAPNNAAVPARPAIGVLRKPKEAASSHPPRS